MKVQRSDLNIESLSILACNIAAIPVNSKDKTPIPDNIDLDLDFKILNNKVDKSKFKILITLTANNNKIKKPGYFFSIIGEGIFKINRIEHQPKDQVDNFLKWSALPILISYLRAHLANVTSYYPYGKYTMPAIDLTELLKNKAEIKKKK